MNFLKLVLVSVIFLAACGRSQLLQAPPPSQTPDRRQSNSLSDCPPAWNGIFIGQTTNTQRVVGVKQDPRNGLTLVENKWGVWNQWIVDGKPRHAFDDHRNSYTAICASLPLLSSTSTTPANGKGIDIEIFRGDTKLSTVRYIQNLQADASGNAFDYVVLDGNGAQENASETYKLPTK